MVARIRICLATAVVTPALVPAAASAAGFVPPPAPTGTNIRGFTYDALVADIQSGRVRRAIVNEQTGSIRVELRDGRRATTGWPPEDGALLQRLVAEGADVRIVHSSRRSPASDLLEALLLVVFFSGGLYLYRRYRNGSGGGAVGSGGGNPVGAMRLRKGVDVREPSLTRFAKLRSVWAFLSGERCFPSAFVPPRRELSPDVCWPSRALPERPLLCCLPPSEISSGVSS